MAIRRRETADTLVVQLVELEIERADLQSHLYDMARNGSGSAVDMRQGLDTAAKLSIRIGRLQHEVRRADERSPAVEELI